MKQDYDYDVIVIGGGHAGCEAALASARLGCRTLMLNHYIDNTALMPCNPSIGGPAKGNLVREADMLGGFQARATDSSTLHLRWLNTSKGFAVRTLRAQCDLRDYAAFYQKTLAETPGLHLYQAMATEIVADSGRVCGVLTQMGEKFAAKAVIVSSGTYLRGRVYMGLVSLTSGPLGQVPATDLSNSLIKLGLELGRFRTDTTPRICKHSIDWGSLKLQPSDREPEAFSHWSEKKTYDGYNCGLTRSHSGTHDIVRAAFDRSPLATKSMEAKGPRYCPSIDDKIIKFPEKVSHPIFLEPVGRESREVYMQNFSTSMPPDVQLEMIRSLPGCGNALMIRPGYAIEYDYVIPTQLKPSLECKNMAGLYFAGQICGTSGYEEAGSQGLMSGINAALKVRGDDPLILGRNEAYIGVLIDDLTTRGTDEPYRMLPSRCEHRLIMRHDNADDRLADRGREIGLIDDDMWSLITDLRRAVREERKRLESIRIPPSEGVNSVMKSLGTSLLSEPVPALELLLRPQVSWQVIRDLTGSGLSDEQGLKIEVGIKYAGYVEREERRVRRLDSMEKLVIPEGFDYRKLSGLAAEAAEKLSRIMPRTLGQAARVPGVNNVDIQLIQIMIERARGERSSEER